MRKDCDICRGSGFIRLPVYQRVSAISLSAGDTVMENSRSYACPHCRLVMQEDRISVIEHYSCVDSRIDDPGFFRHAKDHAAHNLVGSLLDGGFIKFERGEDDLRELSFALRATVGVVSVAHVSSLESRISAHQEALAHEVINEAERKILVWGSSYSGASGSISKQQAIDSVHEALRRVLEKRVLKKF